MTLFATILVILGVLGGAMWWLLGMRPFLRRHHEGYNTGANLLVAAWVDWQRCGEIAGREGCGAGRVYYWGFVGLQLSALIGGIMLITT